MISAPANALLTIVFVLTGLYCLWHLLGSRRRAVASPTSGSLSFAEVVDVNHAIMSVAMIVMIWVAVADVVLWAQVALFVVLALSLFPGLVAASRGTERTDVATHVVLDVAMIWMLAAMPALMAGMDMGGSGGSHHAGHGGDGMEMSMSATPAWADVVNVLFVVACLVVTVWWIIRAAGWRGHRLHPLCHVMMGTGMAAMLVVMNA